MRDPWDDKSSHSVSFSKILIFDLLMAIFSFFGVFVFALYGVSFGFLGRSIAVRRACFIIFNDILFICLIKNNIIINLNSFISTLKRIKLASSYYTLIDGRTKLPETLIILNTRYCRYNLWFLSCPLLFNKCSKFKEENFKA